MQGLTFMFLIIGIGVRSESIGNRSEIQNTVRFTLQKRYSNPLYMQPKIYEPFSKSSKRFIELKENHNPTVGYRETVKDIKGKIDLSGEELGCLMIFGWVGQAVGAVLGFIGGAYLGWYLESLDPGYDGSSESPFFYGIFGAGLCMPVGTATGVSIGGAVKKRRGSFIGALGGAYIGYMIEAIGSCCGAPLYGGGMVFCSIMGYLEM